MNIGFIGLGVMGYPMAQNLQRSYQHQLSVYDIDASRCESLVALGARPAAGVTEAVRDADVVMTSLPGPKQIEAVALGDDGRGNDGMIAQMPPAAVWIDLSTNNLAVAEKIRTAARYCYRFVILCFIPERFQGHACLQRNCLYLDGQ